MNKKVVFRKIGHACFIAECEGQAILFDPWFGAPINHGTFHAVPEMVPPTREELSTLVAIHVSHIHDDHFDLDAAAGLPKNIPVVIGTSNDRRLRDRISHQGFSRVLELEPGVSFSIGPFTLTVYPKFPTDLSFDSSIVLTVAGRNFYIGNDCIHPSHFYSQMLHTHGAFEGGFIGHTIVNPVLWCADFSDCSDYRVPMHDVGELVARVQKDAWHHVQRACEILKFQWFSPYSSEFRFLNRDLLHHNALFCRASDVYKLDLGLTKPILLNPGEKFEGSSDALMFAPARLDDAEITDRLILPSWIETHCAEVDLPSIVIKAKGYFQSVLQRQPKIWNCELLIDIKIQEGSRTETIRFRFDQQTWTNADVDAQKTPDMIVEYPARALGELFKGRWDLPALHRFFLHKVRYLKTHFPPMGVLAWK
ncbi:hypothetical protein BH10BDE1_BH10BDE1_12240 [soil metagenome]